MSKIKFARKKSILLLFCFLLLMNCFTVFAEKEQQDSGTDNIVIWLAGDSTVSPHDDTSAEDEVIRVGWGVVFGNYFNSHVTVKNEARSGRSSKSYIKEDNYETIMENMKAGDYLFVEFGHNDEKQTMAKLYTDPAASSDTEGSFQYYLKTYYIEPALAKEVTPVLLSPVVRRTFENNKLGVQTHEPYKKAMEALVAEYAEKGITIPYIDMSSKTAQLYNETGEEGTLVFHAIQGKGDAAQPDNTHYSLTGAKMASKLVLEGIRECNMDISNYIISPKEKMNDADCEAMKKTLDKFSWLEDLAF